MKVLFCEPNKAPVVKEIKNSLESLQKEVGGYIEVIYPPDHKDDACIIANEEGKILGLELNRPLKSDGEIYDVIAGNFLICRAPWDSEDFKSLNDNQIEIYKEMYEEPLKYVDFRNLYNSAY